MSHRRAGVLAGFTLALCGLVGGCQSTPSLSAILAHHGATGGDAPAASNGFALAPGMTVEWHLKTAQETPNLVKDGLSVVGPDGAIELGPYGSCRVGGLPLPQASAALERHLAQYLRSPTVRISPLTPAPSRGDVAWRKTGPAAPAAVAQAAPQPAPPPGNKDGRILATAFNTPDTGGDKKDGKNGDNNGDKNKFLEVMPPPRSGGLPPNMNLTSPMAGVPAAALPAPNECKPTLLPAYVIGPTDVLQIEVAQALQYQPVRGPHLVLPDGSVRIGIYGSTIVAGHTLDEARLAVAQLVYARLNQKNIKLEEVVGWTSVDVLAFNSKQFFIIADGGGQGDQVVTLPITGNDNVLNAMSKINGLPLIASKHHIWVARLTCPGCPETRLPVDWIGITKRGEGATNWQILPGDRIYVQADSFVCADRWLAKMLAPAERILGVVLLGSQTVNSIKSGTTGGP